MVQWLQDNRSLVLLLCLPLMAFSGYLYLRAWSGYRLAQAAEQRRRRQRGKTSKSGRPAAQEDQAASPLPRTTSIRGEQADLLDQVGQDQEHRPTTDRSAGDEQHRQKGYQSTHIIRTRPSTDTDTPPRPSEIIRQLQDRQPAKAILDEVEQRDELAESDRTASSESEVQQGDYSTTDQFRTTRQLQMPPPVGEQDTGVARDGAGEQGSVSESDTGTAQEHWRADQARLRRLAEEGRRSSAPMPEEPTGKRFHRGYRPAERDLVSALEKAKRLEELGLHIGISPADLEKAQERLDEAGRRENSAIAEVLDDGQQKRLHELGLTEDSPVDPATGDQRMITAELENILDRLDDALTEEEDTAVDDARPADQPSEPPAPPSATDEPSANDRRGDTEDRTPTAQSTDTGPIASGDDAPDLLSEADLDGPTAGGQNAVDAEDRTPTVPAAETPPVQDSTPATPPDERKPAADLPAWARADTFDEDLPDSSHDDDEQDDDDRTGKQQSLFD
ncbi:MAG: hypothetical protein ACOCXJ_02675 [Planctomycetota bacterium]